MKHDDDPRHMPLGALHLSAFLQQAWGISSIGVQHRFNLPGPVPKGPAWVTAGLAVGTPGPRCLGRAPGPDESAATGSPVAPRLQCKVDQSQWRRRLHLWGKSRTQCRGSGGWVWLRHRILTCSLPSWDTIVIKRERLQRHQPGQHGSLLWAMLALAVPNRQMCQAAEQDIQLQVSHHPAAWSCQAHDNVIEQCSCLHDYSRAIPRVHFALGKLS